MVPPCMARRGISQFIDTNIIPFTQHLPHATHTHQPARAAKRKPKPMTYATDNICHNANRGTYGHECGKPATWLGTKPNGFQSGRCDHCKQYGDERHGYQFTRLVCHA